ncbi:hypothetical protein ABH15_10020 [Methanoculleus taiwanensis]|uniref:Uncharacterized protein n=1 Tax=Methanoculleus taiwanensis TaxID=1550565 RepID=A0A498H0G3_9EURY|nr:hypothetical protein [Methanoculleus taiwanensis]RXE56411.1 hypothetical protein ABH15_10020 [Methanoculleus taiwanensis]
MSDEKENTAELEELNRKDITADILLSDFDGDGEGSDRGGEPEQKGDHPVLAILDMAVSTGADYCRKTALPPPNTSVYEHFSKPFLNTALWHYFPDGNVPDDPRIALAVGVGGLALAFTPALLELHRRRQEEAEYGEEDGEKEEKRIKNPVTGSEYRVKEGSGKRGEKREDYIPALSVDAPKEGFESAGSGELPAWMKRLTSTPTVKGVSSL